MRMNAKKMKIKKTDLVRTKARDVIINSSGGISRKDVILALLHDTEIHDRGIAEGTISTQLNQLVNEDPQISRVGRGIFAPAANESDGSGTIELSASTSSLPDEEEFYESFRDYLVNDLNECVRAACVSNMRGNGKWGNPDIVGVQKPRPEHVVNFPTEIVCAEIKVSPNQIPTAFGQAASYLIFSHKTYVVVPRTGANAADIDRLEAQCHMLGIGMVTFELDVKKPEYIVVIRARTNKPNMFHLNDFVESIMRYNAGEFYGLFG